MKPRVTLAETTLPNGSSLILIEHDGRHYLQCDGIQLSGPATENAERELGRVACSPFRPARQPRIFIVGLGLGHMLSGVMEMLPQKKGTYIIAEPSRDLVSWHQEFFPDSPLSKDDRVHCIHDIGSAGMSSVGATLNAILLHGENAPLLPNGKLPHEDLSWLSASRDALQEGGLIAILCSRKQPGLERKLSRVGLEPVVQEIDPNPLARKPRTSYLYLGRRGEYTPQRRR
jgi:spermidine synthase